MVKQHFSHVRHWVFDLDNTLYAPSVRLFDQIERRMNAFVVRVLGVDDTEANRLRKHYWQLHGTTLAGLMAEHKIDPDAYLEEVHDISFDALAPDPHLAELIGNLPGRRIVYTNGSAPYAAQVLRELLGAVAVYAAGGRLALEDMAKKRGGEILKIVHQLKGE